MLVVLANRQDPVAAALVSRWLAHDAVLLSVADLSVAGWHYQVGHAADGTAVADGRVISVREITGVLTRLPWVSEFELPNIAPPDRSYVATEMSAFLIAWLASLDRAVLNRPTPQGLAGPNWRPEQWIHTATLCGLPVAPFRRQPNFLAPANWQVRGENSVTVTVVGGRRFGSEDPALQEMAGRLASASGADLLAVHFESRDGNVQFTGADPWPDVSSPELADATAEYLLQEVE